MKNVFFIGLVLAVLGLAGCRDHRYHDDNYESQSIRADLAIVDVETLEEYDQYDSDYYREDIVVTIRNYGPDESLDVVLLAKDIYGHIEETCSYSTIRRDEEVKCLLEDWGRHLKKVCVHSTLTPDKYSANDCRTYNP